MDPNLNATTTSTSVATSAGTQISIDAIKQAKRECDAALLDSLKVRNSPVANLSSRWAAIIKGENIICLSPKARKVWEWGGLDERLRLLAALDLKIIDLSAGPHFPLSSSYAFL